MNKAVNLQVWRTVASSLFHCGLARQFKARPDPIKAGKVVTLDNKR